MKDVAILFGAAVALIIISFGVPAHASDLKGVTLPGYAPASTVKSNAGGYISVGAGLAMSDLNTSNTEFGAISLATRGAVADIRVGYDIGFPGSKITVGPLAGVSLTNSDGKGLSGEHDFSTLLGGRIAYHGADYAIYAYGGWNRSDLKVTLEGFELASKTLNGIEYGGGVEVALSDHARLGTEIGRIDYGSWKPGDGFKLDETEYVGRVRVGYHF